MINYIVQGHNYEKILKIYGVIWEQLSSEDKSVPCLSLDYHLDSQYYISKLVLIEIEPPKVLYEHSIEKQNLNQTTIPIEDGAVVKNEWNSFCFSNKHSITGFRNYTWNIYVNYNANKEHVLQKQFPFTIEDNFAHCYSGISTSFRKIMAVQGEELRIYFNVPDLKQSDIVIINRGLIPCKYDKQIANVDYKNGKLSYNSLSEINKKATVEKKGNYIFIQLDKSQELDSGYYLTRLNIFHDEVQVELVPKVQQDIYITGPQETYESNEVILKCIVLPLDPTLSKGSFNWNKIKSKTNEDLLIKENELIFHKITLNDNGEYKCKLIQQNVKPLISLTINLKILKVPVVILQSPDSAIEGENMTMICNVGSDFQNGSIKWLKNSQVININGHNFKKTGIMSLHYINVSRKDYGKYTCSLSIKGSSKPYVSNEKTLHVHYPPICDVTKKEYEIQINGKEILECLTMADPLPTTFTWYHTKINEKNEVGYEKVYNFSATKEEKYICSASNELFKEPKETCTFHVKIMKNDSNLQNDKRLEWIISIVFIFIIILCVIYISRKYTSSNHVVNQVQIKNKYVRPSSSYHVSRISREGNFTITPEENMYEEITDTIPLLYVKSIKLLGSGCFGDVYKSRLISSQKETCADFSKYVAVKVFKETEDGGLPKKNFLNEIRMHFEVPAHKHVIMCFGKTEINDNIGMVLEFSKNGTLKLLLRKIFLETMPKLFRGNSTFGEEINFKCMKFAREIASGMKHISKFKIIHRDLATRNILLGDQYECKISDFGLSRNIIVNNEYQMESNDPIPVRWLAPESLLSRIYTQKSDVWSYGIVLWEIVALGGTPYNNIKNGYEVKESVISGYRMPRLKHCNEELYTLMNICWDKNPDERPTFAELLDMVEHLLEHCRGYLNFEMYEKEIYEEMDADIYKEEISPDL